MNKILIVLFATAILASGCYKTCPMSGKKTGDVKKACCGTCQKAKKACPADCAMPCCKK